MSDHAKNGHRSWLARTIIRLNNWRKQKNNFNVDPENVLLLLPGCIQDSDCAQNIVKDINQCKRCGNCAIKSRLLFAGSGAELLTFVIARSIRSHRT